VADNQVRSVRYSTLRQRLELLAFDARLAAVPPTLLAALWEAIDSLPVTTSIGPGRGEIRTRRAAAHGPPNPDR
jgi:hypothetical protein